jgi:hypothetical protein
MSDALKRAFWSTIFTESTLGRCRNVIFYMTYPVESKSYVSPSVLTSDGWRAHFIGEEEKIETAKLAKQDWLSLEGQAIMCHCSLVLLQYM